MLLVVCSDSSWLRLVGDRALQSRPTWLVLLISAVAYLLTCVCSLPFCGGNRSAIQWGIPHLLGGALAVPRLCNIWVLCQVLTHVCSASRRVTCLNHRLGACRPQSLRTAAVHVVTRSVQTVISPLCVESVVLAMVCNIQSLSPALFRVHSIQVGVIGSKAIFTQYTEMTSVSTRFRCMLSAEAAE